MAGNGKHGWQWLEMAECDWKRLEKLKIAGMEENGWKRLTKG
jgi:hypothetical protein